MAFMLGRKTEAATNKLLTSKLASPLLHPQHAQVANSPMPTFAFLQNSSPEGTNLFCFFGAMGPKAYYKCCLLP
eukprot:6492709-Amphidinium_carterae.1